MAFKVAYDTRDGHVATGNGSHAEIIGAGGREYDNYVRAIVFPEKKAVYFRAWAPPSSYGKDGFDEEASFEAADRALDQLIRLGYARKSWQVFYWRTDEKRITSFDVRL